MFYPASTVRYQEKRTNSFLPFWRCFFSAEGLTGAENVALPPGFLKLRDTPPSYKCVRTGDIFTSITEVWVSYRNFITVCNSRSNILNAEAVQHVSFETTSRPWEFGGDQFTDTEFPMNQSSVGYVVENGVKNSKWDMTTRVIQWARLPEVIQNLRGERAVLFGNINPNTPLQGSAGDCWLIAAASCLAEYPQAVRSIFDTLAANQQGRYTINLFDLTDCSWHKVTIDDFVPCTVIEGQLMPLFAKPSSNEMWSTLLEKAVAKFVGSYGSINGGHEAFALMALTGFPQVYQFRRLLDDCEQYFWERGWSQWNGRNPPTCGFRASLVCISLNSPF